MILTHFIAFPLLYTLYNLHRLHRNITIARSTGLPYIIHPYYDSPLLYALFSTRVGDLIISICKFIDRILFPQGATPITDRACFGSAARRHTVLNRVHERYGQVVVLVAPGAVNVVVADAGAAVEVLGIGTGGARFPKATVQYRVMEVYGENVVTTEGKDWVRHRKFTTGPFNERNSSLVWRDSIYQTLGMVQKWRESFISGSTASSRNKATPVSTESDSGSLRAPEFQRHVRALALHVISASGFGVNLSFLPKCRSDEEATDTATAQVTDDDAFFLDDAPPPGFKRTYRHALDFAIYNLTRILLVSQLPDAIIKRSPKFLKNWYTAREEVRMYLNTLITNEKRKCEQSENSSENYIRKSDNRRNNLLSLLVRNQQQESGNGNVASSTTDEEIKQDGTNVNPKFHPLNSDEILGNVFLFSLAGHETTATTMQFSLGLLAITPSAQEWLHKELDEIFISARSEMEFDEDDPSTWPYELYAQLKAPLCVMYETLRFFPPAGIIPRWTASSPQSITFNSKPHIIPAYTDVTLNGVGLHFCRDYWGDDVDIYDPSRWDPSNASSFLHRFNPKGHNTPLTSENNTTQKTPAAKEPPLLKPLRGSWIAFSDGLRACLGKKFAQVEFTAVLTVLLRKHRVEIIKEMKKNGELETEVEANRRAKSVMFGALQRTGLSMSGVFGVEFSPRS